MRWRGRSKCSRQPPGAISRCRYRSIAKGMAMAERRQAEIDWKVSVVGWGSVLIESSSLVSRSTPPSNYTIFAISFESALQLTKEREQIPYQPISVNEWLQALRFSQDASNLFYSCSKKPSVWNLMSFTSVIFPRNHPFSDFTVLMAGGLSMWVILACLAKKNIIWWGLG